MGFIQSLSKMISRAVSGLAGDKKTVPCVPEVQGICSMVRIYNHDLTISIFLTDGSMVRAELEWAIPHDMYGVWGVKKSKIESMEEDIRYMVNREFKSRSELEADIESARVRSVQRLQDALMDMHHT